MIVSSSNRKTIEIEAIKLSKLEGYPKWTLKGDIAKTVVKKQRKHMTRNTIVMFRYDSPALHVC